MNEHERTHEYEHKMLEALVHGVPGFSYAYTHDAQFHAIVENRIRLMLMEIELMVIGTRARQERTLAEVRRLEREPQGIIHGETIKGLFDGR